MELLPTLKLEKNMTKCQTCKNQDQAEVIEIKGRNLCEVCWIGYKLFLEDKKQGIPLPEEIKI